MENLKEYLEKELKNIRLIQEAMEPLIPPVSEVQNERASQLGERRYLAEKVLASLPDNNKTNNRIDVVLNWYKRDIAAQENKIQDLRMQLETAKVELETMIVAKGRISELKDNINDE